MLTLMKGDKGIKLCQKLANLLLLFYIWCWNRHFKEHTILDGKTVRPRTGIAVEIHEGMPISTFEKVFKVGRINVMRSKYSIKRRHYASSSQFIAVNINYLLGYFIFHNEVLTEDNKEKLLQWMDNVDFTNKSNSERRDIFTALIT